MWDLYFSFSFVAFIPCIAGIKGCSCSLVKMYLLFRALIWIELHFCKAEAVCAAVSAQPQDQFVDQKINLNRSLLWDEFFGYWLTSFITWSETIYVSINK